MDERLSHNIVAAVAEGRADVGVVTARMTSIPNLCSCRTVRMKSSWWCPRVTRWPRASR
ncbi:hypothetical protein ACU4HD_17310 [Cupriavidus basilensis]